MAKFFKKFNSVNDANIQGASGLNTPHVSIVKNKNIVNIYDTKSGGTFIGKFDNNGKLIYPKSIEILSYSYNPNPISYSGGTTTPLVSYVITYSNNTTSTSGAVMSYSKISGVGEVNESTGVITWDENTLNVNRETEVSLEVSLGSMKKSMSVISIQNKIDTDEATAITINSYSYDIGEVESSGGTSTPTLNYTIYYRSGNSGNTGGTVSYVKNSGEATVDNNTGVITWEANMTLSTRTSNVKVVVSKDSITEEESIDNTQKDGHGNILGEIIYWNGNILKYTPQSAWTSDLGTPVGVCVITKSHTSEWGDGKPRYVAVNGVNVDGTSATTDVGMAWNITGADTPLQNLSYFPTWNNSITSPQTACSETVLQSSDIFSAYSTAIRNVRDTKAYYLNVDAPAISPYDTDESFYSLYSAPIEILGVNFNAFSDLDGKVNTETLTGLGTTYSAANACHLYSTDGTSVGDWYLPSMGELGYLMPRFGIIQSSLTICNGILFNTNGYYWSSTEKDEYNAQSILTSTGLAWGVVKTSCSTSYARPFIKI